MSVSQQHQAIAAIAYYLEQNCKDTAFDFMDGGLTLDIQSGALQWCRENEGFDQLEQDYLAVGGNVYCPDSELWEVA